MRIENINVPHENFVTTKQSGHELEKENQDPGILPYKRLAKSPGSVVGKRRKRESKGAKRRNKKIRQDNSADKACSVETKLTCYLLAPMAFNNCWFSRANAF